MNYATMYMGDSALVEEVLSGDDERTPTDLLCRRGLKCGCSKLSSDSESASCVWSGTAQLTDHHSQKN